MSGRSLLNALLLIAAALPAGVVAAHAYTFTHAPYTTGSLPVRVAVGDLNGDGRSDLVTANLGGSSISVLLGTGSGAFGAKTDFATGGSPYDVALGDFNGDSRLDAACPNFGGTGTVSVLLGNGAGGFGPKTDFALSNNPSAIAVADVNNNGTLDLVVTRYSNNTVTLLLGNGAGSFAVGPTFPVGTHPMSVTLGHLNADANIDISVANEGSNNASILLGTGGGNYGATTNFAAGLAPNGVRLSDVSSDGKLDLIVGNRNSGTVSVLLGNGLGSFGAQVQYPTGGSVMMAAPGDFDADGKVDLAAANNNSSGSIAILLGNGAGAFAAPAAFPTGSETRFAAVGDFNADGRPDIAAPNSNSNTVSVLLNAYTIIASTGPNGTVSPSGVTTLNFGQSQTYTITPDPAYYVLDVVVDGVSIGAVTSHAFTSIAANHTISASFAAGCLTPPPGMVAWYPLDEASGSAAVNVIAVAPGSLVGGAAFAAGKVANGVHLTNGSVSAANAPSLNFGSGSFTIDMWMQTNDAATSVRTIADKRAGGIGYSIYISFGHLGFQLADASGFTNYGTPSPVIVNNGWHHVAVTVDRAGGTTGGRMYVDGVVINTFNPTLRPGSVTNTAPLLLGQPGISFNGDIDEVEMFARALTATEVSQLFSAGANGKCKPTWTIAASAGANGSISPSGSVSVQNNASKTFTITPAPCAHVVDVLVDGLSVGAVTTHTFNTVTANHTIAASFALDTYTITASAGPNGAISPTGAVAVNCGADQAFTITPAPCYHVADVLVDGISVGPVTAYTFSGVTAAHTIAASFAIDTYSISASAGADGSISPSGVTAVNCAGSQPYTITPAPGYYVLDVLVDGSSVGAVTGYTFTNVTANHTISASFATGCLTPPPGMVAWYALDETSHPTAVDRIGNAHGAFIGGATHVAGNVAGAVHLATGSQYVTAADAPSLNFGTGSFTIDAWVQTSDAATSVRTILDKRAGGIGYSMYISFGHIGFQLADASGFTNYGTSSPVVVNNGWHHVAVTVDRAGGTTGGRMYVDGTSIATFDPTLRPGSITNTAALRLGQSFDGGSIAFNGEIDEVELFGRALTATEISQLHSAGSNGKCKTPVTACLPPPAGMTAWWPLDETSGTIAADLLARSHATYVGGAGHVPGRVAGGAHIGASTQYVEAINSPALNFGTGSFTIDAWVQTADAATSVRTILDKRAGGIGYSIYISFGHIGFQLADASGFTNYGTPSPVIVNNGWHHVAVTVDRAGGTTGGKMYVDGVAIATFNPTLRPGSVTNNAPLRLGQSYNGGSIGFNGDIDEVELFNRALDASEIAALFAIDGQGKCKQTVVGVTDNEIPGSTVMLGLANNPLRNGSTGIRFALAREERVNIHVFDVSGRLVHSIEPGSLPAGQHVIPWNGEGADGRPLQRGMYFVKVVFGASGVQGTRRLVILR